jgi:hypothetical protein
MGNYEIYYVVRREGSWSLPVNVSHTTGYSAHPALVVASDSTLYATWMDSTPGYWVIYYGSWNGRFWSSQPVPNARGQIPTMAASPDGSVYLAWQDRVSLDEESPEALDIFASRLMNGSWSLPVSISDLSPADSLGAAVTATADGLAHLVWVEGDTQVRYCYGGQFQWSVSLVVANATSIVHGPRIVAEQGVLLHVAWDEGDVVRATTAPFGGATWLAPASVAESDGSLQDVALTLIPSGGIAVGWVQTIAPGDVGIYESTRDSAFTYRLWLPVGLHP